MTKIPKDFLPPVPQPITDEARDRTPVPPDPERVEGIIVAMGTAAAHYCQDHNATMADVLSACFTMCHRTVIALLYHTTPPLNIREQYRMRQTIVGGVEKLWNMAVGGGATSKFDKH